MPVKFEQTSIRFWLCRSYLITTVPETKFAFLLDHFCRSVFNCKLFTAYIPKKWENIRKVEKVLALISIQILVSKNTN